MLACARIGAVHSVVFGGFSAESVRDRMNDAQAKVAHHRRRRLPPRPGRAAQADGRPGDGGGALDRALHRGAAAPRRRGRRGVRHDEGGPRPLVAPAARRRLQRCPARADGRGGPALHPLHLRHHGQAEGHRPHDGRLSHPGGRHHQVRLRPQADGRVLVHGRRRLGDRALVRRLRPARQRRDGADVRGRARLAGAGPVLVADRDATASPSSTPRRPPSAPS